VLAERFRPTDRALFMAGLEPGLAHWGAWGLADWSRRPALTLDRWQGSS
jgi:hypothetical protein